MATIDEIINNALSDWEQDSNIDKSELISECQKTALMHSKYLRLLTSLKSELIDYDIKLNEMREARKLYFQGKMGKEDLKKYGWEQYQFASATKTEAEKKAESSPEVIKIKRTYCKIQVAIETLTEILKGVTSRGYYIRNMIDMKKFNAGDY